MEICVFLRKIFSQIPPKKQKSKKIDSIVSVKVVTLSTNLDFQHFERCRFWKKTLGFQCFYVKSDAAALSFCLRLLSLLSFLDVDTDFDMVFTGAFFRNG